MKNKDLNHTSESGKVTALRSANNGTIFIVAQGKSWCVGLTEEYKEFSEYIDAISFFNSITISN